VPVRPLRSRSFAARSASSMGAEFRISRNRQIGTLSGLLGLCGVLWILSPYFLTVSNLLNIAEQTSIIAVVAAGMTFVIITAGIDLSVGSLLAFSGVVMASSLAAGRSIPLALTIGLLVGLACGIGNGVLISIGRLPPFIATLGMMSIARGSLRKGGPFPVFPRRSVQSRRRTCCVCPFQ
jgi:ribose/xylose/arabinose/galactoside ABC-type transport system permease subunit